MPPTLRKLSVGPCIGAVLLVVACGGAGEPSGPPESAPSLTVEVVLDGLDHPWDVAQAPDGTLLVDERTGRLTALRPDGERVDVRADLDDLFATGETGLMGLVLDPAFEAGRRFYTCQGIDGPGGASIAVLAWTMAPDWSSADRAGEPVVDAIPVNADSGRHGGCRLRFDGEGALLIGTGDNAVGSNPQDLSSRAGKVLRVDPATGNPWPGNPFAGRPDADPLIWTYGHRNVQGLAVRPDDGTIVAVEQGTDRDDEVTLLAPGVNGGYDPDGDPDGAPDGPAGGYDESVPMTDDDLPDVVSAAWASGAPTIATSGGTFLAGPQWGEYEGLLVVGVQKDTGLLALRITDDGDLLDQFRIPELEDSYGRIRTPQLGSDGALYVTTDNGDGADVVLKVTPTG